MPRTRAAAIASLGLAGLLAGGMGIGVLSRYATPEAVLSVNYGKALADADTSWTSLPPNIWLSGLGGADAPVGRVLTVGDTITIDGKDGRPEVVEVTARDVIDGDRIGIPGVRFQLVTARAAHQRDRTVRFMFATEAPSPVPALPDKTASNRVL